MIIFPAQACSNWLAQVEAVTADQIQEMPHQSGPPDIASIARDVREILEGQKRASNMHKFSMACSFAALAIVKSTAEKQEVMEVGD